MPATHETVPPCRIKIEEPPLNTQQCTITIQWEAAMSYQIRPGGKNSLNIYHEESNSNIGYVRPSRTSSDGPRYRVINDDFDEIAVVNSVAEALPTLIADFENRPRAWRKGSGGRGYFRMTQVGDFQVGQDENGRWLAYRYECPLMRDGRPATFPSRQEAQAAADLHVFDGYDNRAAALDDGLSWLPDAEMEWSGPPAPGSWEAFLEREPLGGEALFPAACCRAPTPGCHLQVGSRLGLSPADSFQNGEEGAPSFALLEHPVDVLQAELAVAGKGYGATKLKQSVKRASSVYGLTPRTPHTGRLAKSVLVNVCELHYPSLFGDVTRPAIFLNFVCQLAGFFTEKQ
jgi:hypothetical protein